MPAPGKALQQVGPQSMASPLLRQGRWLKLTPRRPLHASCMQRLRRPRQKLRAPCSPIRSPALGRPLPLLPRGTTRQQK